MKAARNSKPLQRHCERVCTLTEGGPKVDIRGLPQAGEAKMATLSAERPMWVNGPGGHMRTLRDKKE
jgi:hypothetical protein